MDPVTLGVAGIASTALGAVTGAAGSIAKGQAEAGMYNYQASVAKVNQQIALQNADYEYARGEVEAQQAGMATRAQIGKTKAIQSASGLDVNTGSAAIVRQSEAEIGVENVAVIRNDAARRAYGQKIQAMQADTQAKIDTMAASNAERAGQIGAISSILGGAGSVASKWYSGVSSGLFKGFGGGSSPMASPNPFDTTAGIPY